jgi:hypothetical protein
MLLGPATLGVEVTEAELAARCGLGNIDPQHGGPGDSRAAIEAALDWPPPAPGATLATIRIDADACGAMAVLTRRAQGRPLCAAALRRLMLAASADKFHNSGWPGPRPLPASIDEIDEVGVGVEGLGAMIGGLFGASVDQAVQALDDWLATGAVPAAWLEKAQGAASALFSALRDGRVTLRMSGGLAVVEGFAPGALRLGYRLTPVVAAIGGSPRRATIAQYALGHIDLRAARDELSAGEPGWGGSATLIGSPQGVDVRTPLQTIIDVARRHSA